MSKYVAILRGINVGKGRKVLMTDLKNLLAKLGLKNIQTYIQSGNVMFDLRQPESLVVLEDGLNQAISGAFGFDIPVIIRTAREMEESVAINPFLKEDDADIDKLHLTFLKDVPAPELLIKIKEFQFSPDQFEIIGKEVFVHCPNGYGQTKITNDFFEKKLKVQATTRNWKTVQKLHELSKKK